MSKTVLRILVLLLTLSLAVTTCGCKQKTDFSLDSFKKHENTFSTSHTFLTGDTAQALRFNEAKLRAFQEAVVSHQVEYGYELLFDYEKAIAGIQVDHTVTSHQYSALDAQGNLTANHLFQIVRQNNPVYLASMTSLIKDVEDAYLQRICQILVDVINDTLAKYPDIDKTRVYCNLGNLKVVEKTSALDFAAVEPGMVLHINRNTSNMVGILTDSNMYSVLVHEAMHIIQFGCQCEQLENCVRRCGLAHAYANREQDYSDWIWMAEASAEQMASLYANVSPMTYKNMVNYLLLIDLSTMLDTQVPANYGETLYFYCDLEHFFDLFGATTDIQKQEIYQMIYALEIMQSEPIDIKDAYLKHYGQEWTNEVRDEFNYDVKASILQTLTKCYLYDLAEAVLQNRMTTKDFLFLLNLYESTVNYHLRLENTKYDSYNAPFVQWYATAQGELFACLENVSAEDYFLYVAEEGNTLNATLHWLDNDKKTFLIAKAEATGCGYKFSNSSEE